MSSLRYEVIRATELTPDLIAYWRNLQDTNPSLASPFFCPEFTATVASARSETDDVFVGLLLQENKVFGFFPFQRNAGDGLPVGNGVSDFQGVIVAPDLHFSARELVQGCRLRQWHFNHLITEQSPFEPFYKLKFDSRYIDLSVGFEKYAAELRSKGSGLIKQVGRLQRKMEREIGPVRFETSSLSPEALKWLMAFKTKHLCSKGKDDIFRHAWIVRLLEELLPIQTETFGAVLSLVYVADRLAAADLAVRSATVLHQWFGTYDQNLYAYSPGLILTVNLLRNCPEIGIKKVDMGRGPQFYKQRLCTHLSTVAEGCVEVIN